MEYWRLSVFLAASIVNHPLYKWRQSHSSVGLTSTAAPDTAKQRLSRDPSQQPSSRCGNSWRGRRAVGTVFSPSPPPAPVLMLLRDRTQDLLPMLSKTLWKGQPLSISLFLSSFFLSLFPEDLTHRYNTQSHKHTSKQASKIECTFSLCIIQ